MDLDPYVGPHGARIRQTPLGNRPLHTKEYFDRRK